ncbi:GDSL esterase/lipase At3g27950-like [Punica granatum]|uniref:GDSL esterase/lipase At3g27950-like n=1 Tax=Punica granatum TaxID=22663 RepID=A0A6P8E2Y8_PUNGR|nr:GDSL esterase/lipase At3g27950-like [Punica granatum]XP_031404298.1 GDSL esterase/lipase At3g27950-like [Punica granatum]
MLLGKMLCVFVLLGFSLTSGKLAGGASSSPSCKFPAIYNFGDSNSDTGAHSAVFVQIPAPYGETFFKKPSKRLSDGRVIIDIIAEKLGVPYLSAYLDSLGTNFRQGANFATAGSSILPGFFSPFDLGVQISQFSQFKSRTTELYNNVSSSGEASHDCVIPKPDDFLKALYVFDIGQNDLTLGFQNMTPPQVVATFPNILNRFTQAVQVRYTYTHLVFHKNPLWDFMEKEKSLFCRNSCPKNLFVLSILQQLYGEGARSFWIHNTGPLGCIPLMALPVELRNVTLDPIGCVGFMNDVAQEFNQQLKEAVTQLRTQLPQAKLTYVDVYAAKFALISDAKNQGFAPSLEYCCGTFSPVFVMCGTSVQVNGTTFNGTACSDPSNRIIWDGIHYTEAANLWVASRILNGSFSDPPVPISGACP